MKMSKKMKRILWTVVIVMSTTSSYFAWSIVEPINSALRIFDFFLLLFIFSALSHGLVFDGFWWHFGHHFPNDDE